MKSVAADHTPPVAGDTGGRCFRKHTEHEEYIPGDNDCMEICGQNRRCHPGGEQLILMNRAQAVALLKKAAGKQLRKQVQEPEVTREQLILQLCHGLVPICIGLTWILGAFEGLADPAFTSIVTGVCVLWGCVNWKWGKVRA